MRAFVTFIDSLLLTVVFAWPSLGGKNAGGSLIVHTNDSFSYTTNVCTLFAGQEPASCEAALTQSDHDDLTPTHIWVIASFVPTATPGVAVVYFGFNHNLPTGQGYFENFGYCGPAGTIEVPDTGWPDLGGNSVAFGSPISGDTLFAVYYVNVYKLDATSFVGTGINPTGGYAAFIDDSHPAFQDDVTHFGAVRWGQAGSNQCPTPPIAGACCVQEDASCIITFEGDCITGGGVYLGDGSTCSSPCGPCCYWGEQDGQWFRRCVVTTEADCQDVSRWNAHTEQTNCGPVDADFGTPGIICTYDPENDEGWYCEDPRIGDGACCLGADCRCIQPDQCNALGGVYLGGDCSPITCPNDPGACCYLDGRCEVLLYADCQGHFLGPGTTCDPNSCPIPSGACCFYTLCVTAPKDDCLANGGVFIGIDAPCSPNPCPPDPGACCTQEGACTLTLEQDCAGEFHGWGVPCSPNPCPSPTGACCFNLLCVNVSEGDCTANGGAYLGDGVSCDPNPCFTPPSMAACCVGEVCTVRTQVDCLNHGGVWIPDQATCEPSLCAPTNTQTTSWGAIKAAFR